MTMSTPSPRPPLPLSRFALFQTGDLDKAREEVAKIFCPHRLAVLRAAPLDACHHSVDLGGFSLNYVQYGADVLIEPGELGSFFLLQIPLAGHAGIQCGSQSVEASPVQGSLLSPSLGVRMTWSQGCGKLLVLIRRDAIEHALQAMLGRTLSAPIEFQAALPLDRGSGARIAQMVRMLRDDLDSSRPLFIRAAAGPQMREALIMALLHAVPHSHSARLAKPAPSIAPRHVRHAEEFMRARAAERLTLCDIAQAAGVSTRSLQEGFRQFRDTTPMEALRDLRLDGARRSLLRAAPGETVTEVALAWGFSHLGRFAIGYAGRFGERPSDTLRRAGAG